MATASVTNTFVNGATITHTEHNTNFQDLVDFLNTSVLHRDGSKAATGALPMGGFKITGLADGSAATDAVALGQVDPLVNPVTAGWFRTTDQSIPSAAYTDISWDGESWDEGVGDTPGTRLTVPDDGIYLVSVFVEWDNTGTFARYLDLVQDDATSGVTTIASDRDENGRSTRQTATTLAYVNGTSDFYAQVRHDQGAAVGLGGRMVVAKLYDLAKA